MFAAPLAALAWLLSAIVSLLRMLPREVFWALATAVGMALFYEGISIPTVWPVSLVWSGSIVDGRVDRVRNAADARCEAAKALSRAHAERADGVLEQDAFRRRQQQLDAERERTLAAQAKATEHEISLQELTEEQRTCRIASPADDRRVFGD